MLDIGIAIGIAVLTAAMAYMGVHVSLHPPDHAVKGRWRLGFITIATAAIGLIAWQTQRGVSSQTKLGSQIADLHSQLNKIQHNTETPPTVNVLPSPVVINPAPAPVRPVEKPVPPPPPAYLGVVAEADDLGDKIDNLARKYVQAEGEVEQEYKSDPGSPGRESIRSMKLNQVNQNMRKEYQEKYRNRALAVRDKMLDEVTDIPVTSGTSMWNNSLYQEPNNDMLLTAIAENLRGLARQYKEKMSAKQAATQ